VQQRGIHSARQCTAAGAPAGGNDTNQVRRARKELDVGDGIQGVTGDVDPAPGESAQGFQAQIAGSRVRYKLQTVENSAQ